MRPAALRLIVDAPAEAAWNMAVDEALLLLGEVPTLRFYGWSPHAVSLGYFQRAADFADLPPGTPLVRRLTGGGAIHHGNEITFALTLDAAVLPTDVAASYRVLHDAAVTALAVLGIASERLAAGAPQHSRPQQRWCFAEPGQDDIITAKGKLLGSAQRRIRVPRSRVLHHGSLVLQRPTFTPFVAATEDAAAASAAFIDDLRRHLAEQFASALSLSLEPGIATAAERALAEQLCSERYRNPAFVRGR